MNTTLWTKIGGTKFIGFMVLAVWAMIMIQNGVHADKDWLEFLKYIFWGFVFGNVGAMGVQTFASTKADAMNGSVKETK